MKIETKYKGDTPFSTMTYSLDGNGAGVQQNSNGAFSSSNHNLVNLTPGLSILAKELWALYRPFKWDAIEAYKSLIYAEDVIEIGMLFVNLGIDPIEVHHWLSGHPLREAVIKYPVLSTKYEGIFSNCSG